MLKTLRKQRRLSQDELGALAGMHGRHIGRFEIGGSLPGVGSVVAVARALGVSTDYLLRDDLDEEAARGSAGEAPTGTAGRSRVVPSTSAR